MAYEDDEIQKSINNNFKSELEIKNKANERLAQEEINKKNIDIATADKMSALQFALAAEARTLQVELEIRRMAAEAKLVKANKWNGQLPANIVPESASFIFGLEK